MIEFNDINDLDWLCESVIVECKLGTGQDGRGKLPDDFWPTYSAFANTHGGLIILGVKEKQGKFELKGVPDADRIIKELFDNLNNKQKVSINLITDAMVRKVSLQNGDVILIEVPVASRKQKPVYLNGNPMGGNSFKRLHEGDRKCDDEDVKRMLTEQIEDDRDQRILKGFGLIDLDAESLRIFRQSLYDRNPTHPFLEHQDASFLQQIGAWRRDRSTGDEGLTLAGLLMFGQWHAIQAAVPHYFVDYQERPEARTENRWVDRICPDGSWSGNVFDFYRRVYRKITSDIKIPFELKGDQRRDDTPVHEALREALVNTLVHADYSGRLSILVVKRPDMFGFRNPGGLRLPIEQVLRGGESDCRNRLMHQMFLMIGLGERGGSGVPKIYSGWGSQHWRPPALYQKDDPEQTLLELRMLDLLPEPVLAKLRDRFKQKFDALKTTERLVLATAEIERVVTHQRLLEISTDHPHDLSTCLQGLVRQGYLETNGRSGKGTVYHLPGENLPTPDQVFSYIGSSSEYMVSSSEHLNRSSEHLTTQKGNRNSDGCWISPLLTVPIVDDIESLSPILKSKLEGLTNQARNNKRLASDEMKTLISSVCRDQFLTLHVLAKLLNRSPDALRQQHLNEMVRSQQIGLAFPATPTHEKQAYRSL
ncbi:MAG: putative DNA binding domain-containing protein [Methylotenera sp.]|uniref:RNA-binding domain-containing protein n=1 Tax=Methylotenera sp. TaxID=2051956 RepID=UPI0024888223|nr:RNA-binding domain-containing protein [Methylotenera sp.]MDI1309242.1 putative DNA binding domain-containing protein [Methylotenera sp.]